LGDNGWRWRVLRTSDAYSSAESVAARIQKVSADRRFSVGLETGNQALSLPLLAALDRLKRGIRGARLAEM